MKEQQESLARKLNLHSHCLKCNEAQDVGDSLAYPTSADIDTFQESGFCPKCWSEWKASPKRIEDTLVITDLDRHPGFAAFLESLDKVRR